MQNDHLSKTRERLNQVSPCFCLAKWFQVTIHLQNGHTHSCHLPQSKKIPLEEIKTNPSALHNTNWKKEMRRKMLTGERPAECNYCWGVEDADKSSFSDRSLKSSEDWAIPNFDEAKNGPWDFNFNPRYVEISFGNACNFKCMYCYPFTSSSIMNEFLEHGHYKETPTLSIESMKSNGLMPFLKDEHNPYVDAFWEWWPELTKDLKVFRITGGEPLVNPNTFTFLDYLRKQPMPELVFAMNSNLGILDSQFDRFLISMKDILENKKVKSFEFFTSIDTYGKQAEYIRNGLNFDKFISNVRKFLDNLPNSSITFMCTYNILSVVGFRQFLQTVINLKKSYIDYSRGTSRITLDIPFLRDPEFMSYLNLTPDYLTIIKSDLDFLQGKHEHNGIKLFNEFELNKMKRIYSFAQAHQQNENIKDLRKKFYSFYNEYDRRKGTDFLNTFPEMSNFWQECKSYNV